MKKYVPIMLVAAGLMAFGFGCAKNDSNENANIEDDGAILNEELILNDELDLNANIDEEESNLNTNEGAEAEEGELETNTNTASTNTNTAVNTNTSTTNTNSSTVTSDTITITSPEADEELESPFYVEGTATSGSLVYVRLKTAGVTVFTEQVSVRNGAFRGKLLFDFSHTTSGTIEVFQKDADNNETGLASVNVRFKLNGTNSNTNSNSNANTNS